MNPQYYINDTYFNQQYNVLFGNTNQTSPDHHTRNNINIINSPPTIIRQTRQLDAVSTTRPLEFHNTSNVLRNQRTCCGNLPFFPTTLSTSNLNTTSNQNTITTLNKNNITTSNQNTNTTNNQHSESRAKRRKTTITRKYECSRNYDTHRFKKMFKINSPDQSILDVIEIMQKILTQQP